MRYKYNIGQICVSASVAPVRRGRGQREMRMRKPDRAVLVQTAHLALGVAVMIAVMLIVYAVIGKLTGAVILGAVYAGILGVANFFVMGMMVQNITDKMAEKQRSEQEIADMTLQMSNRMKLSYNMRMLALFGLLVLGIAVFHFDALATILAALFPSVVIRVLQIIEARKNSKTEGSEEP